MKHPECQCKIELTLKTKSVRSALVEFNSGIQTPPFGTALCSLEHLRLDIDGDNAPALPDQLGKRKCEIAEPAPKICYDVSIGDQTVKNGTRVVDIAPERIVKGVAEPPGTGMLVPGDESVKKPHSEILSHEDG